MNPRFKKYFLQITNASKLQEIEVIQSLWGGYGKISRYQLIDSSYRTVVVKCISLKKSIDHPRGWNTSWSHNRKVKSYEVETNWYESWNLQCSSTCRTPKFLGSFSDGQEQWIILEDLNDTFPLRKFELEHSEVKVCLQWLANFHMAFMLQKPIGLWEVGTYWHLETRPDEYEKIAHQELKSKAHKVDALLNQSQFKTFVHGDAKLANFCFSEDGQHVAAVDFQYVGGGCGMKDVAYFLGSCLSSRECELYESSFLDVYFCELRKAFQKSNIELNITELEVEWRRMYPLACADFTRFLLGWMPTNHKVNRYNLNMTESVLARL